MHLWNRRHQGLNRVDLSPAVRQCAVKVIKCHRLYLPVQSLREFYFLGILMMIIINDAHMMLRCGGLLFYGFRDAIYLAFKAFRDILLRFMAGIDEDYIYYLSCSLYYFALTVLRR